MENCGAAWENALRRCACRTAGRKRLSAVDIVGEESSEVGWWGSKAWEPCQELIKPYTFFGTKSHDQPHSD